jgi:hypothetical protein
VLLAGVDEAVDAVKRAYQAFDASGKGHVSAHDIFRVMEEQVFLKRLFLIPTYSSVSYFALVVVDTQCSTQCFHVDYYQVV